MIILFYIFFLCVVLAEHLEFFNYTKIKNLSSTGCVFISLRNDNQLTDLLYNLSEAFRDEPNVHIGTSSVDHVIWSDIHYDDANLNDTGFALYERQPPDRTCLLNTLLHHPVAIPYHGQLELNILTSFLNQHCHTFRTALGSLEPPGVLQELILNNLYHLHKPHDSCHSIESTLSKHDFFWKYLTRSRPVIVRNAIKEWPAFDKWTTEYLRQKYGQRQVHVKLTQHGNYEGVESAHGWPGYSEGWIPSQVRAQLQFPDLVVVRPANSKMHFSEFLDMITVGLNASGISCYLEYSSIPTYMPQLEEDIYELPFVEGLMERKHLNMWLSDGHTLGKLHFDPYDNLLCQLSGEKHVTLFEPHFNENLYEAHIPEALLGYDKANRKIYRKRLLESTSMVMSPVDITKPNYGRFPKFAEAKRLECILKPGDVLFMPSFWWHEVQSYPDHNQHRNLAVNFWYKPLLTKEFPCPGCRLEFNHHYDKLLKDPAL
jgi:jumonji domain-containing protein 7